MDILLQTHGAKRVFPIPEGLKELTSDIVREVLRHQPECIYAFVAEYLETMLVVREKARDSAVVVSSIYSEAYFFEDLYRRKKVNREEAEAYATVIQAAWRGYVIRKKFRMFLQKRRKLREEREKKKTEKIEVFLESIGLTYDEATRAACIIQVAYRQARRGRVVVNDAGEEVWMEGETVPLGQRIREADRAQGRYDRWDKEDWGNFFEMKEDGGIKYDWPRVGQLFKIPRNMVKPDMEIVNFFAALDLQGKEQYTYLKGPQKGRNPRGFPVGFLIPLPRDLLQESSAEVSFVNIYNNIRMGNYTYVYERIIEKQDLNQFTAVLMDRKTVSAKLQKFPMEMRGEFDYDPAWVLPRILIQIRKDCILDSDDEVVFLDKEAFPEIDECYTFRAETTDASLKVMNYIQQSTCDSVEEAMTDTANIPEYRQKTTGRLLAVEDFTTPKYIQKVVIAKESKRGAYENKDMDEFEYVFVPRKYKWGRRPPKPENPLKIPLTRFQGHKRYFRGSTGLEANGVFIMGPMLHSPDGRPLNFQSVFWDEFGPECWYQLLCEITTRKISRVGEGLTAQEEAEEEEEIIVEEEGEEEDVQEQDETEEPEAQKLVEDLEVSEEAVERKEYAEPEEAKNDEGKEQEDPTEPTKQENNEEKEVKLEQEPADEKDEVQAPEVVESQSGTVNEETGGKE